MISFSIPTFYSYIRLSCDQTRPVIELVSSKFVNNIRLFLLYTKIVYLIVIITVSNHFSVLKQRATRGISKAMADTARIVVLFSTRNVYGSKASFVVSSLLLSVAISVISSLLLSVAVSVISRASSGSGETDGGSSFSKLELIPGWSVIATCSNVSNDEPLVSVVTAASCDQNRSWRSPRGSGGL